MRTVRPQYTDVGDGTAIFQSSVVRDLGSLADLA